ncbi:methyl-accepting chemotaxis protein [Polyangium aurulentum]|uniref:methyl-accepting chemotaxis protein n=1 Tax=Polyangium aurulentum TaxID=2567896 RepID=UPI0010AEB630|nr:methyl-accepting chemotaxis protein [Polyangium aurulentum]UQA58368.1 CHASE3 domain-containing protein [Polyangium aurulentum]
MFRSWTVVQQGIAASVSAFCIMVAVGVLTGLNIGRLLDASRAALASQDDERELSAFLVGLDEAEAGKRGYVITGEDEDLAPYHAGKDTASRSIERLRVALEDDPAQKTRVDALASLVTERMREMDATVEARRQGGFDAAAKAVREDRERKTMARIRALAAEMRTHQQDIVGAQRALIDRTAARIPRDAIIGGIIYGCWIALAVSYVLARLSRRVVTAVARILGAAAELEAAAAQQGKGAKGQVAAATEVSTTVSQLVSTSRQIAESAQQVTQVAGATTAAAKSGTGTVEGAQEAIDAVRRQVDHIVTHMLDLGKRSQEIGGILDIINDLAEQTNILAINATIEAVGAGDAGRRFGVVASEIRKLADRVGGSTKDIRRLIEEIRGAANTTVMATEDGAKAVDIGSKRFTEVTESFRRIVDLVGNTAQAAREIELSTKQQTSAMEQVAGAIADVAQTARESESGTAQTVQTAAELMTLANQLTDAFQRPVESR